MARPERARHPGLVRAAGSNTRLPWPATTLAGWRILALVVGVTAATLSGAAHAAEPGPAMPRGASSRLLGPERCVQGPPARALSQALAHGPVTAPARGPARELIGLYYFRARYYDPAVGRFISRDPVWDPTNVGNPYTFVGNSPVTLTDPTGEIAPLAWAFLAAASWWAANTAVDTAVDYGAHRAFGEGDFALGKSIAINAGINALTGGIGAKAKHLGKLRYLAAAGERYDDLSRVGKYAVGLAGRAGLDAGLTTGVEYAVTGEANLGANLLGGLLGHAAGDLAATGVRRLQGRLGGVFGVATRSEFEGLGEDVSRVLRQLGIAPTSVTAVVHGSSVSGIRSKGGLFFSRAASDIDIAVRLSPEGFEALASRAIAERTSSSARALGKAAERGVIRLHDLDQLLLPRSTRKAFEGPAPARSLSFVVGGGSWDPVFGIRLPLSRKVF